MVLAYPTLPIECVVSTGTTGEEWLQQLATQGRKLVIEAREYLQSQFVPTMRREYHLQISKDSGREYCSFWRGRHAKSRHQEWQPADNSLEALLLFSTLDPLLVEQYENIILAYPWETASGERFLFNLEQVDPDTKRREKFLDVVTHQDVMNGKCSKYFAYVFTD